MFNHRMLIRYDGRPFFGWQRHGEHPTVQGSLEKAIERTLGQRTTVRGSGRTDRGAHACGQVASFELNEKVEGEASLHALRQLNAALPSGIEIMEIRPAVEDFHACDTAIAKRYRYEISCLARLPSALDGRVWHLRSQVDPTMMAAACKILVGRHDFASFATASNFKPSSTTRTIFHAALQRAGPRIRLEFCGDGFLYKMVRNLVRALVKVGEGRSTIDEFHGILAAKDRGAAPGTAPASGLYLDHVFYPGDTIALSSDIEAMGEKLP